MKGMLPTDKIESITVGSHRDRITLDIGVECDTSTYYLTHEQAFHLG